MRIILLYIILIFCHKRAAEGGGYIKAYSVKPGEFVREMDYDTNSTRSQAQTSNSNQDNPDQLLSETTKDEVGSQEDSNRYLQSFGDELSDSPPEVSKDDSVSDGKASDDSSSLASANAISGVNSGGGTSRNPGYYSHYLYLKRMPRQERRRIEQEIIKRRKPGELISYRRDRFNGVVYSYTL